LGWFAGNPANCAQELPETAAAAGRIARADGAARTADGSAIAKVHGRRYHVLNARTNVLVGVVMIPVMSRTESPAKRQGIIQLMY
jgi:hypothetical protein